MKELIKIQRMCFNDGPGIRTTLFFKGCPLTCPWCCNIENTDRGLKYFDSNNIDEDLYGKYYDIEELTDIIIRDKNYFGVDGGVTYSGGEPLLHSSFLKDLSIELKKNSINIAIETSLCTDIDKLDEVYKFIDFFYVDIKTLDDIEARDIYNIDLNKYYENIRFLIKNNKKIVLRWTISNDNYSDMIKKIISFMKDYKLNQIEICSVHNLAKNKYEKLGMKYDDFKVLNNEVLTDINEKFIIEGIKSTINSI